MTFHALPIDGWDTYEEWQELRRSGIGASDVAALVGLSPWSSPFTIFCEKLGLLPDEPNEAMLLGRRLEGAILEEYSARSGRPLVGETVLWRHPEYEWARCTTDALNAATFDPACELVEAKASLHSRWDSIPLHYQAQCQWAMWVLGVNRTIFAVLHQGSRFETYPLDADQADQQLLIDAASAFWRDHVETQVPPKVDGQANQILAHIWPDHSASTIDIDPGLMDRLSTVHRQMDALKRQREQLEAEVKAALGENAEGLIGHRRAVSWKTQPDRRIDIEALRNAEPDIAEKFTVESTKRVLRLHGDWKPQGGKTWAN